MNIFQPGDKLSPLSNLFYKLISRWPPQNIGFCHIVAINGHRELMFVANWRFSCARSIVIWLYKVFSKSVNSFQVYLWKYFVFKSQKSRFWRWQRKDFNYFPKLPKDLFFILSYCLKHRWIITILIAGYTLSLQSDLNNLVVNKYACLSQCMLLYSRWRLMIFNWINAAICLLQVVS